MNKCGTCRFFSAEPYWEAFQWDDEKDEQAETPKYHKCELLEHLNGDSDRKLWPVAGVIDGSGYRATFCVQEDFGCTQWESRATGPRGESL